MLGLILWDQKDFEELLVIDEAGVVVASTYAGHESKSAQSLEYFTGGLKATYTQTVFISPITGKLTMVVSAPIKDEGKRTIGVLAARLNLTRFFTLLDDRTGLGKTGETVVGKKASQEVVFMAPTRHDPAAALQRKVAIGSPLERPLQEAAMGQEGSGIAPDYRNVEVLAAWAPIPALGWGLAVQLDTQESRSWLTDLRDQLVVTAGILVMLALLASLLFAEAFVRPLRKLKDVTEKISRGDLDVSIDIRSGDEVGELADSFERMIAAIKFFRTAGSEEANAGEAEAPEEGDDSDPVSRRESR